MVTDRDRYLDELCILINNDPQYLAEARRIYAESLRLPDDGSTSVTFRRWRRNLNQLQQKVWKDMVAVREPGEITKELWSVYAPEEIFDRVYTEEE